MENNVNRQQIELGVIISLLIPMFYTAGWSYAYHYFDCFGLGLMGLDIPKEYLFVYSFWAVKANPVKFAGVLILAAALYAGTKHVFGDFMRRYTGSSIKTRLIYACPVILIPGIIFMMFWLFYSFGEWAAEKSYQEQAEKDFISYPSVNLWLKTGEEDKAENKSRIPEGAVREWEKGGYRLLLRNKENLYLFYPSTGKDEKIATNIIPAGKIEAVRVMPR